ncbi:MFS transporter [Micromonospora sp. NBC_01813]|uniref:MFS transporter n=1 Tax=Micromonospora sp. NBC_01813 TaxID=2975988 RepID=UPI002DD9BE03|nr:MFS transporter [Micromonospora sp. NBC_01813]WSA08937.1 MFS transporter [Micromonospora sp. NBC_01813]
MTRSVGRIPAQPAGGVPLAALTCAIGLGLVMLDNTALTVSLPTVAREVGISETAARWLFVTFMLANLAVLPSAGALAARVGRRRGYQIGLVLFGAGSLLALVAGSFWLLVVARVLQGAGGAMMIPNSAALLDANVAGDQRVRAVAAWVTISSVGIFVGPVIGGLLTETLSWRLIFLVELVAAAVGLLLASRLSDVVVDRRRLDLVGMLTGGAAVCLACAGILEAGRPDPDWVLVTTSVGLAVPVGAAFLIFERRTRFPAFDLRVFSHAGFGALIVAGVAYNAVVAGGGYVLSLSLQVEQEMSASVAGWAVFATMALIPVGSQVAGRLTQRFGLGALMSLAALWLAVAYLVVGVVGAAPLVVLALSLPPIGLAVGVLFAGDTAAAMSLVRPAALPSALTNLSLARQVGSVVGVTVLGSIYQQVGVAGGVAALSPLQVTLLFAGIALLPAAWLIRHRVAAALTGQRPVDDIVPGPMATDGVVRGAADDAGRTVDKQEGKHERQTCD